MLPCAMCRVIVLPPQSFPNSWFAHHAIFSRSVRDRPCLSSLYARAMPKVTFLDRRSPDTEHKSTELAGSAATVFDGTEADVDVLAASGLVAMDGDDVLAAPPPPPPKGESGAQSFGTSIGKAISWPAFPSASATAAADTRGGPGRPGPPSGPRPSEGSQRRGLFATGHKKSAQAFLRDREIPLHLPAP